MKKINGTFQEWRKGDLPRVFLGSHVVKEEDGRYINLSFCEEEYNLIMEHKKKIHNSRIGRYCDLINNALEKYIKEEGKDRWAVYTEECDSLKKLFESDSTSTVIILVPPVPDELFSTDLKEGIRTHPGIRGWDNVALIDFKGERLSRIRETYIRIYKKDLPPYLNTQPSNSVWQLDLPGKLEVEVEALYRHWQYLKSNISEKEEVSPGNLKWSSTEALMVVYTALRPYFPLRENDLLKILREEDVDTTLIIDVEQNKVVREFRKAWDNDELYNPKTRIRNFICKYFKYSKNGIVKDLDDRYVYRLLSEEKKAT